MKLNHWKQAAQGYSEEMIQVRRHLHQNPELSFQEHQTTQFLLQWLSKKGIPAEKSPLGTGVIAKITGAQPGPVLAAKADIDALPIQEDNAVAYASQTPGVMHACGHDAHTTILLFTAWLVHQQRENWRGTLWLIFQPGEEKLPGGAKPLLDAGIFGTLPPDYILALHSMPDFPVGTLGFRPGRYMASGDEVYLTIKGQGGHAALPDKANDTVVASAAIVMALQQLVSRNAPPAIPSVLSFGKISGGTTMNILPALVNLQGTFRTFDEQWRKQAKIRISEIARHTAHAYGCEADVKLVPGYPFLMNNQEATKSLQECAVQLWGSAQVRAMDLRMTTDDFAWFSQAFPAVYFRLGVKSPQWQHPKPLHTPQFDIDEQALPIGLASLAAFLQHLQQR